MSGKIAIKHKNKKLSENAIRELSEMNVNIIRNAEFMPDKLKDTLFVLDTTFKRYPKHFKVKQD